MKRLIGPTMMILLLAGGFRLAGAGEPGKQKKHQNVKNSATVETERGSGANLTVRVEFGAPDVQLVRSHYATRFNNLPPGLQKKISRGGSLPPGWQKKMEPFPVALERQLPPLPSGYSRGVFDAHAGIYNQRGNIIDIAVLF